MFKGGLKRGVLTDVCFSFQKVFLFRKRVFLKRGVF